MSKSVSTMSSMTDKKKVTGILWQKCTDINPPLKRNLQLMSCTRFRSHGYWGCLQITFKIWNEQCVLRLWPTKCRSQDVYQLSILSCNSTVRESTTSLSLTRRSVLANVFLCGIRRQENASTYGLPSVIWSFSAWRNLRCLSSTWTNVVHSPTTTGRATWHCTEQHHVEE